MRSNFHKLQITRLGNRSANACLELAARTFGKDSPEFQVVSDFTKEKRAGSVSANIDVTHAYRWCKEHGRSFATAYHWASAKAINEIDALKMRIENDLPVLFDTVHVSTTIARSDGTFGFSFTPFDADFESFHEALRIETDRVKAESGLKSPYSGIDVLYFTVLRKVKFTMMEHAHGLGDGSAIPFLTFGESFEKNGRLLLPHSLRIHHSLVDGQHVGLYYERLEEILKEF